MEKEVTPRYITLEEVDSTNSWLKEHAPELDHGTVVSATTQTAGRGQRGNTWESRPGMNLTVSMLLRPENVAADEQFSISEAVALGVAHTIGHFLGDDDTVAVKWPNDIYWTDRKICGILIENVISGRNIVQAVAGIGLNVNQSLFESDAPNPVSMCQIAGREFALQEILDHMAAEILRLCEMAFDGSCGRRALHSMYIKKLWRRDGFHPYRDAASGRRFMARISGISPSGIISLEKPDGTTADYAFKEVKALVEGMPL